jgi:hypothetical protein
MKLGHLKISLLITILPLYVTFSQGRSDSYPIKQFNSKHLISSNTKEFNPLGFTSRYNIPHQINVSPTSLTLLDSIVEICQPPYGNQKYIFYYDNAGRVNYYIDQDWYNGKWNNSTRDNYYYDSLGNLSGELIESYSGQWIPWFRITNTYDEKRKQISDLYEDYTDSLWVNTFQDIYKYDSMGNLVNHLNMQWDGKEWVTIQQAIFFIKEGARDSLLFQDWVDGQWVNSNSAKPEYDSQGNLIKMLWKSWTDSQWVNYLRGNWNYGLHKNIVSGLIEDWDGNEWINDSRFLYSYNSDNNFIHGLNEIWQNGSWTSGDGLFYFSRPDIFSLGFSCTDLSVYYKNTSGVEKTSTIEGYSLFQNYPNPFNPSTTIRFTIPSDGLVQLQVYDILGREIATLVNEYRHKGKYEVKFDTGKLSSGIYIYRINCGTFTKSRLMVLQK